VEISCTLLVHLFGKSDTAERKEMTVQSQSRLTVDNWVFGCCLPENCPTLCISTRNLLKKSCYFWDQVDQWRLCLFGKRVTIFCMPEKRFFMPKNKNLHAYKFLHLISIFSCFNKNNKPFYEFIINFGMQNFFLGIG
jgi:hypothetical protein